MAAINDIVFLGQGITDLMPHEHEYQPSAAPFFELHVHDSGSASDRFPYPQRTMELDASAGPHAPGQFYGRQEPSAPGVPVRTQFRLPGKRQEIEPMPQRRQQVAGLRIIHFDIERCRQRGNRRRSYPVRAGFGFTHPLLQVFDIQTGYVNTSI